MENAQLYFRASRGAYTEGLRSSLELFTVPRIRQTIYEHAGFFAFRTKHFSKLNDNAAAQVFVEPWLAILDSVISKKAAIYEKTAKLSFLLGKLHRNSIVSALRDEAMRFLPSYVDPLNFGKRRP